MSAPITVPAAQVKPLLDMAAGAGLRVETILASVGLPAAVSDGRSDLSLPLADFFRLQQAIGAALEDETCQLSERQLLPGTTDFVLSKLSGSTSLFDAMKMLAQYYNLLHGGEFNSVSRRGGVVAFTTDDRAFPYTLKGDDAYLRFSMECVQMFLHCMLATISEKQAGDGLRRVRVVRGRDPGARHLEFWSAPISYGSPVYVLEYSAGAAAKKFPVPPAEFLTADHVYAEAIALIEARESAGAPHMSAAGLVREGLRQGAIDQQRAALLLGVSVATLRRRLAAEGASFRELRRDVLNDAAKAMLGKGRAVIDVAEELGFSDFRSFNRAFREWNGVSPRAFADRVKGGRPGA